MELTQLKYLSMIRLDVTMWSGRAKLRAEDLPAHIAASLPPEQVATMGTKRLFDADKLKIFSTLKARAARTLDAKCVKFLGGWATHEDHLPGLAADLAVIANEFRSEHEAFCRDYVRGVAEWAANFPDWSHILINAVPKVSEIQNKFSFAWQGFKISPENSLEDFAGNNMNDTLTTLEQEVIRETAQAVAVVYRDCFEGKEAVTKKAYRPLRALLDKLRSLSFIHQHIYGFEHVLGEIVKIGESDPASLGFVTMIKAFLVSCSTPNGVNAVCEDYAKNKVVGQALDPFWAVLNAPAPEQQFGHMYDAATGTDVTQEALSGMPTMQATVEALSTEPAEVILPPGWPMPAFEAAALPTPQQLATRSEPTLIDEAKRVIAEYDARSEQRNNEFMSELEGMI